MSGPYQSQAFTVELSVPGALDGSSLGPPLVAPSSNPDPQGFYRPPVPGDLGIVNVDYRAVTAAERRGCLGNRYVAFLTLELSAPGGVGAALQVVDATVDPPFLLEEVRDLAGETDAFVEGILVPQGSALRLVGVPQGPVPHRVRFTSSGVDTSTLIDAQQHLPPL